MAHKGKDVLLVEKMNIRRRRRAFSRMDEITRSGRVMRSRSAIMSAAGTRAVRIYIVVKCRVKGYALTSWHMATSFVNGHCGLGFCFQSGRCSHTQMSCARKKAIARMNDPATQRKRRFQSGSGSIRIMEKRIDRRADQMMR